MTTPDDIVKYVRSWKGTRWKHQGRGLRGIDCAGVLVVTMQHFELPCEDVQGYGREPGRQFVEQLEKYTDPTHSLMPVHGAIAVFNDTIMPCHTGVFVALPDGTFTVVHSEMYPARRVVEEEFDTGTPSLKSRLMAVRLFKDVEYV